MLVATSATSHLRVGQKNKQRVEISSESPSHTGGEMQSFMPAA